MEHPDKGPREETMREKFGTMGVIQSLDANEPLVRGPCAVWVERDEESNIIDWGGTMTPQEAYIMVTLLQSTVNSGTLRWAASTVDGFDRPIAGKTGTVQNWSDAWTVGFTPQIK